MLWNPRQESPGADAERSSNLPADNKTATGMRDDPFTSLRNSPLKLLIDLN